MHRSLAVLAVAGLSTALAVTGTPVANAASDATVRTGRCSGSAHWKLAVKPDNGRLQVEYEVDSNTAGQRWRVGIRDNGLLVARTTATTAGRSGSFSVERRIANRPGSDHIVARARHLAGGQVCVARLTF